MIPGEFYAYQPATHWADKFDDDQPAEVWCYANTPCTPQGSLVAECATGKEAKRVAAALNDGSLTIEDLRKK